MKEQSSRIPKLVKFSALLTLLASAFYAVSSSSVQNSQDNRQLQRDSSRPSANERRTALVIGNGAYTNAPPLKNPPNDARDMAATLKTLGFEVTSGVNLNQREMKRLIREFGQSLKAGGSGLFYYAGHGVQSKARNFLIPIEADIQSDVEVEDAGVDVNLVLGYMDDAQNSLNIVILDACRDNPFARSFRSAGKGLAQVDAPTGTLIAYATAPGRVASDGTGQNGLYTAELLKQMRAPGLSVTDMFMHVRAEVMKQTANKQVPWEASSLVGAFYFTPPVRVTDSATGPTADTRNDPRAIEREYWETIRNSNDTQDYKEYLQVYPNGAYAGVARAKIRQIDTAKVSPPANVRPAESGSAKTERASNTALLPKNFKNQHGIEMVYIPAGSFLMGSTDDAEDEKPAHRVTINYSFSIGKYEVTQAQWQAVMGSNPAKFKDCGGNCPVEQVSWNDAQEFVRKLNRMNDGYTYRLPSEAEWEYACRAGTTGDYAGNLTETAWYLDNSGSKTRATGQSQPNAWGLFDMHGNVWEWCEDWYHETYSGAPTDGSAWLSGGEQKYRVLRGGSWGDDATSLRSANRAWLSSDFRSDDFGFRVVAVR